MDAVLIAGLLQVKSVNRVLVANPIAPRIDQAIRIRKTINMLSANKNPGFLVSARMIALLLMTVLVFPVEAALAAQAIHYKFDEGSGSAAADSSGNGNGASLNNNPAWIAGQFGTALSFDGANQYADTAFTTDLPQWSVALWVRSPNAPGSGSATGPVHRERNFVISWDHPAASFRGVAALSVGGTWHAASFGTIAADTWYHLAATYDGETLSVYKNGALVSTNTDPSGPPDAEAAPLKIGKHAIVDNYFAGDVDDVFIFSHVIDLGEVQDLMQNSGNPDLTPPQISNIVASALLPDTATITWQTDENSDSRVNWGPGTGLGQTLSDAALLTSHSIALNDLSASTTYFFEVVSADASLNTATDNNAGTFYSFTTPATAPAPTISNVQVTGLSDTGATITWNTNLPSDSSVDYGETAALGSNAADAGAVTAHSVTLTGLIEATSYVFQVSSTTAGGTTTDDNGGLLYSLTTPASGSDSVLHYKFDEGSGTVAIDASGNGQHGTLSNNPAYIAGQFGSALAFNGANQAVDSGFATDLPAWSVALWVRSPAAPQSGPANGPVHREKNFVISWNHPAASFRGVAAMSVGGNWYAASFGQLSPNTWYHLTATYDGETLSVYKNGALVNTNTSPSGPTDPESVAMQIGRHAAVTNHFAGDVDDVFIFPRAIDLGEVQNLMAASGNPDSTPPQISNIAISAITPTSATVSWLTDEYSDSRIDYGTTGSLGQTKFDSALLLSHSIDLTNLSSDTTYFLAVESRDSSLNLATDDNGGAFYSFVTPPATPAPVISNVQISNLTGSGATITWTTDLVANSQVNYGTTGALGQSRSGAGLVMLHSIDLSGLNGDTTYFLEVSSTNSGGTTTDDNGGALYSFATTGGAPAPVISNVQVTSISSVDATITWDTDVSADSQVSYGTTGALGQSISSGGQVTGHSVTLIGLGASTSYLFEVSSTNAGGTTTDDNGGSLYGFTTSGASGLTISNIQILDITGTSATVTWNTNVPSHASVERNIQPIFFLCPLITFNPQADSFYCTTWDQIPTTNPVVRLAELQPNTEYHIRVRSAVEAGGEIFSQIHPFSFTTLDSIGVAVEQQVARSNDDAHEAPGAIPAYSHTTATIIAGTPSTTPVTGGWRWDGLAIPAGATITEAWVELDQNDVGTGFVSMLSLENSPAPASFSIASAPPDRWNNRTLWEIHWPWPHTQTIGSTITTSSLVIGVQELVDTHGGVDSIVVLERGFTEEPSRTHKWSAYDLAPSLGARLHIQFIDPSDQTTPIISNVQIVPGMTSATVTWDTNENSNSRVNFGTTTSLGQTEADSLQLTSHSVTIDPLNPSTTYFLEVQSQDGGLNVATDDNGGAYYSFQTSALPPPTEYLSYAFDTGSGSTAVDSSGNGRDGTLINSPVWVAGQSGTALSFNGSNNYVETGLTDNLAEWSVALWVRSPNAPGFGAANGPVHREKNFAISWNHNSAVFRGAAAMRAGGSWYSASFGPMSGNTWYYLVATYDGETMRTYKNGALIVENENPSGPPDAESATLKVGRHATTGNYFAGEVDKLMIFERALTLAEVQALML